MQTTNLGKYCLVITSVETNAKIKIGKAEPTTENKRLAISFTSWREVVRAPWN